MEKEVQTDDRVNGDPGRGRPARLAPPRLRASERRLVLWLVDQLVLIAALAISLEVFTSWLNHPGWFNAYFKWFVTLMILWWPIAYLFEAYDLTRAASAPYSMISAASAAGVTVLIYQWVPILTPPLGQRSIFYLFGVCAVAGIALWRGLYAVTIVQPEFHQRALVLGAGGAGIALAREFQAVPRAGNPHHGSGYQLVAFFDDDPAKQGQSVAGIPVLGGSDQLVAYAEAIHADEVVLAITHAHTIGQTAFDALLDCRERGVPVTTLPALYERLLGRIPVEHAGRDLGAVLPMGVGPVDRVYRALKRFADVWLGGLGLLALALVTPFVAAGNALFAPGPLFYRQSRVGRGGRRFTVVKFRTMIPDAERESGARWSCAGDERITAVGRWLRRSRLDELPQCLNVVRGEMSFVGPRPERPEIIADLATQIPFYRARHAVRPGLTGWAQVRYGYGNSVEDARIKLEYDLYYVRHAGFALDTIILLKTLAVIFRLQGT